jgi:hypothetical protein
MLGNAKFVGSARRNFLRHSNHTGEELGRQTAILGFGQAMPPRFLTRAVNDGVDGGSKLIRRGQIYNPNVT